MAILTAEEITNLYLYGRKTVPSDLASESLIRESNKTSTTNVDINEYMATAGRFASPALFKIIEMFFESSNLSAGIYTKDEMRQVFGLEKIFIDQQQWAFRDDIDDYAERVYIWNSVAFKIDNNAVFHIGLLRSSRSSQ